MSAAREGLLGELFPGILKAETSFASGTGANIEELLTLRPDVVFYLEADKVTGRALEKRWARVRPLSPSKYGYDVLRTYEEWIKTSPRFSQNAPRRGRRPSLTGGARSS